MRHGPIEPIRTERTYRAGEREGAVLRRLLSRLFVSLALFSYGCAGTDASPPQTDDDDAQEADDDEPSDSGARSSMKDASARDAGARGATMEPAAEAGPSGPKREDASAAKDAAPSPDASPSARDAAATDGMTNEPATPASGLPSIPDPGAKGPFAIEVKETLEGLNTHILIAPKELGRDGMKHPILVWINGAGTGSSSYRNMLDNIAAHGFFLLDDKQSTFEVPPEVMAQKAAIDWAIAQAEKQGGPYFGKLDTKRIAIAGHSLGSVSTFGNVADKRIKTSIHMAGGVVGNPQGVDEGWLKGLHVPSAFLCGDADRNGIGRVRNDFAMAPPTVPVFFGLLAGVGHTDEFNQPNGGRWGRFVLAWLSWQVLDEKASAKYFVGADCEFCKAPWTGMKRAID